MMELWRTRTLIVPLLTLHISLLFPHASSEVAVKCWWRGVSPDSHDVSIECQADPQGSMLECDLCHVQILSLNRAAHISPTGCSHTNASFSTLMDANEMRSTNCMLLCPGNTSLPCLVQEGYAPPTCLIPFHDEERNIHCHWTLNRLIPTNFSLHWTVDDENESCGYIDVGESDRGIIPRLNYSAHERISIWVSAASKFGKIDSEILNTNTDSIMQPDSSIHKHDYDDKEYLGIFWNVEEQNEVSSQWQCKVQYKKQCDQDWTEDKDIYQESFSLKVGPFTIYEFRVRCSSDADERAVMSEWSQVYTVETPAAAPVGMLDVWSDCDSTSDESSCTILWKGMPKQQARGNISNYTVTMELRNGSVSTINGSVYTSVETCAQCELYALTGESSNVVSHAQQSYLPCAQEQSCFHSCRLSIPVKEVKAIRVTANTAVGKSSPALVALPRAGLLQPAVALEVRGKNQELSVLWSVPPLTSESVQEYVVQHKPVGLPGSPCVKWVKVPKNQTSVTLRAQFSNYTAYNVSLFAIVNNSSCLLKSAIAFTVEGVPPIITDFQATPTSLSSVNLTWTPIPLHKSRGHVMQYLVGFSNDLVVHSVSSDQSSFQLPNLNADQQYEVWISAKTSTGEGERATASFTTPSSGNIASIVVLIVSVVFVIPLIAIVFIVRWCLKAKVVKRFYAIPDPINSSSFKQMSNQFWHSWPVPSASMEYGLTISQVEVVPEPEVNDEPEVDQAEEHREPEQGKELRGLERSNSTLHHQKEYSQMIDTSDEEGREEDEDEEWNEQPFPSDYEKHFIPCIVDA